MGRKGPSRSTRARQGVDYAHLLLETCARIFVRSGYSPRALAQDFQQICRGLKEPKVHWDPDRLNFVSDLPHIMAEWYTDPQYLDVRGAPRELPWKARGPSLSALIEQVLPSADPKKVVTALVQLRAVRQRGRLYIARGRELSYINQTQSAVAHGLTALLGMANTLETNIWGKRRGTLFERAAMNPRFPVQSLPVFYERLKAQADPFVWGVDRDMRRYEKREGGGRTTRLGVCVFAFEDVRRDSNRVGAHTRGRRGRRP
jgi:hypothetical protein